MKPYGLRPDRHRYILNDNDRRDPDFTDLGRKRARAEGRKEAWDDSADTCAACGRLLLNCPCESGCNGECDVCR